MSLRRLLPIVLVAAAAVFAAPGTASAAVPCWKQVMNDWLADGRIDRIYEDSCYAKALEELPQDLEEYSSVADEIMLARDAAQRGQLPPRSPGDGGEDGRIGGGPALSGNDDDDGRGPLETFLVKIGPKNADEVPLPLLILGAIATLLMATGAAGMVARRTQQRRLGEQPPL